MIDIHLTKTTEVEDEQQYMDDFMMMTNIIMWLITTLSSREDKEKIIISGYMVLYDTPKHRISTLIVTDGPEDKIILECLKEPPEPYKGKYVANKLVQEPEPVTLQSPLPKPLEDPAPPSGPSSPETSSSSSISEAGPSGSAPSSSSSSNSSMVDEDEMTDECEESKSPEPLVASIINKE